MASGQPGRSRLAWQPCSEGRVYVYAVGSGTAMAQPWEKQGLGGVPALQKFDPSQDLFDAQFGDRGWGNVEVLGTSGECEDLDAEPDYEEDYLEEGTIV
ncbi:hypothetical protein NDU88_004234 [Pleurodeles waltl]|uniref:Uncharacterized protein n=1 Tax=Pleurodeles waltl TaxID=8319 RepID=A0AAV7TS13_PLEWA|nr:hypothetical protein NDU88_004234 [Pleurodeles waltl]